MTKETKIDYPFRSSYIGMGTLMPGTVVAKATGTQIVITAKIDVPLGTQVTPEIASEISHAMTQLGRAMYNELKTVHSWKEAEDAQEDQDEPDFARRLDDDKC